MKTLLVVGLLCVGCSEPRSAPLDGLVRIYGPSRAVDVALTLYGAGYFIGLESYGLHVRLAPVEDERDADVVISGVVYDGLPPCASHDWDDSGRPHVYLKTGFACGLWLNVSHELVETLYDPGAQGTEIADPCNDATGHIAGEVVARYVLSGAGCWPN